ncbi:MAG: GspH/FimT family pseudopilin [Nitrospiria bacterium]
MISNKGYTAIELVIGLALIGVLSVLGLVNHLAQKPHNNLRDAGRQIVSQLRLLRQEAVVEGTSSAIQFMPGDQTFQFVSDGRTVKLPTHIRFGVLEGISENPSGDPVPDDGISFSSNKATFEPNGTYLGVGGAVYLTNAPSRDETLAITVNMTGRVKLYKWDGSDWQ